MHASHVTWPQEEAQSIIGIVPHRSPAQASKTRTPLPEGCDPLLKIGKNVLQLHTPNPAHCLGQASFQNASEEIQRNLLSDSNNWSLPDKIITKCSLVLHMLHSHNSEGWMQKGHTFSYIYIYVYYVYMLTLQLRGESYPRVKQRQ